MTAPDRRDSRKCIILRPYRLSFCSRKLADMGLSCGFFGDRACGSTPHPSPASKTRSLTRRLFGGYWIAGSSPAMTRVRRRTRVIPLLPDLLYPALTSSAEGRFARSVVASGMRCGVPRVWFAARHSGGAGAPPGPNTGPCQELADDRLAYPNATPFSPLRHDGEAGTDGEKRGPVFAKSPLMARREAPACRKARATGFAPFGVPSPS